MPKIIAIGASAGGLDPLRAIALMTVGRRLSRNKSNEIVAPQEA